MLLENRPVAVLDQPPWRATIDFGSSMCRGAGGNRIRRARKRIARATQLVNVPRPVAEFKHHVAK